jgi:hypothetical protein
VKAEPDFIVKEQRNYQSQVHAGKSQYELLGYHMDDQFLCLVKKSSWPWEFVIQWLACLLGWIILIPILIPLMYILIAGLEGGSVHTLIQALCFFVLFGLVWWGGFVYLRHTTAMLCGRARRWYPDWLKRLFGIFPSPDLEGAIVFNRWTGKVRHCSWYVSNIYCFSEITGSITVDYKKSGAEYSVDLSLPDQNLPFASLNRSFDRRSDAVAYWEFVQSYMAPGEPLPGVPLLDQYRSV